ncbi:YicC/YloC family endoribonuclease [Bacillus massilinigeriensis]|uniref:YicC/YloC family endoribonuclease n=1 Tax=Bacillus massilionigeriensis TaxID=1805475 RepID=UPI00096B2D9E|nr:YicC/YloC family endoribonuclease [Bacillus massilionigeriensis]
MVLSMTGFGRSKKESASFSVTVEIKSVNHRFSEFVIRMPRQLLKIEDKLKKKMSEQIKRGRVEVFVTVEGSAAFHRKLVVDWELLDQYYQYINEIQNKYALQDFVSYRDLLNREDLFSIEEENEGNDELEELVAQALEEAIEQMIHMREIEGKALKKDLEAQLQKIELIVHHLTEFAPTVVLQYQERLTKKLQEFLSGEIDQNRILTEVGIFADKSDINEELTRLKSHLKQFLQTLLANEPIGRKLDFLVQEMNREVNTIGSKANHSSIAQEVVEMKSLLEKVKEQVQNIE